MEMPASLFMFFYTSQPGGSLQKIMKRPDHAVSPGNVFLSSGAHFETLLLIVNFTAAVTC